MNLQIQEMPTTEAQKRSSVVYAHKNPDRIKSIKLAYYHRNKDIINAKAMERYFKKQAKKKVEKRKTLLENFCISHLAKINSQ